MPVPAMPAATSPSEVPRAPAGWDMVVVHRTAAPPLRFMGREVCRADDAGLWIRIWQVRSAGYVLAHTVEDGQRADRHHSADAAMTALESYCARIDSLGDLPDSPSRLHLTDMFEEVARLSQWRRRFRALAGQALDRFDAWLLAEGGVR
jgi:hypothetical protein